MSIPKLQASFNSGEWAPQLAARVDLEKYKSAAALLRNMFVDYRGGVSTRPGTKYIIQAYKSATAVRMIPFQASLGVGYALEFGDGYIRPFYCGAPVLETALDITGISKANPCVVTVTNTYTTGDVDWVYITGVSGMSEINGRYFIVHATTGSAITLYDLFGNPVDSSSWGTWTSGGTVQRVYTIPSPYAAADLALIKFAQNITELILCHPNYVPYSLQITSATNWTITPLVFGTTITAPTGVAVTTTLSSGTSNYAYMVTAVDSTGAESVASSVVDLADKQSLATTAGTNTITWTAVSGATSYNVYKANPTITDPVPAGVPFGFIGNVSGTSMVDSYITPDFTSGAPVARNPFISGSGLASVTVTTGGTYTSTLPTAVVADAPTGGITATVYVFGRIGAVTGVGSTTGFVIGDVLYCTDNPLGGALLEVTNTSGSYAIAVKIVNPGSMPSGTVPYNNVVFRRVGHSSTSGVYIRADLTWEVYSVIPSSNGSGYIAVPSITFSAGSAAATAVLSDTSTNNPSVPVFFQQRLALAAPPSAMQTIYFSQPGRYRNYNISNPVNDANAITAQLVTGQLNNIKAMIAQPAGLIVFSDGASWLVNGGSTGSAIAPAAIVANAQSFDGCADLQPIVANYDILFVTSKGSSVRDSTYNFYANIFTGIDISVLSSHLFFGYHLTEWAWAQEPYKIVWAVRDDGTLLSLTFIKDQDFIAWAHSDTQGSFKSVCTVVENTTNGNVNAVYVVVERTVAGQTVQYIERMADRYFSSATSSWCVDAGLSYSGSPATTFSGGEHLAGLTVTGLADGQVITPFVMPSNGRFTLPSAASVVVVGLGFTAQLKTMALDMGLVGGETVQGKPKKISAVTVRVADTLGLKIGSSFNNLVAMKDLVEGNVGSMLLGQDLQVVSGLFTGDARTFVDPTYTVPGQFCIQQDLPYPATILGVIPEITVGNTSR